MKLVTNTPYKIFGDSIEQGALNQFTDCLNMDGCTQGALMPDSHLGYSAPIGSVLKLQDKVSPALVGFDIGCGVACLELGINYEAVDLEALKSHILKTIPIGFNGHSKPQSVGDSISFEGTSQVLQDAYSTKGVKQLGTLGGGNHFIEVGYLESNHNIAIVIHSGSRGLGHTVASHYMREAASQSAESGWNDEAYRLIMDFAGRHRNFLENNFEGYAVAQRKYVAKQKLLYMKKQNIEGLHSFDINSEMGKQYMIDQNFCLDYALLNRKHMINIIANYVEAARTGIQNASVFRKQFINRNHNHAELQTIKHSNSDGSFINECYIIHRKGATHAEKDMLGVIPGNMRDGSFIVKGLGNLGSMSSSSHGAGRVLSRKKAKATLSLDEFKSETSKLVTNHTEAMLDEAPKAYKNIFEVMKLQESLVTTLDRVIPILNIKG